MTDPTPVGSPFQAPRDCILFGWTLEEKEEIARAQRDRKTCWECGRVFLPKRQSGLPAPEFCSYDCEQSNRLCFSLMRDNLRDFGSRSGEAGPPIGASPLRLKRSVLDDRWAPDPLVVETAFMPEPVPYDHQAQASGQKEYIRAFCALCKTWLGPFKRRGDATKGLRRHLKTHGQEELFR